MTLYSGTLDNTPFEAKADVKYLLCMADEERRIFYPHDPEFKDDSGTVIRDEAHKAEIRAVVQRLMKRYKSDVQNYNGNCRITTMFIETRFDEDGHDGEQWDGIEFKIKFYVQPTFEFITIEARDKSVTERPYI